MVSSKLLFRRLSSAFVLVAWLVSLVAPAVAAHPEIDFDCGDAIWLSDHHKTAFEDVRQNVDSGHCELCHLQRALRGMEAGPTLHVSVDSQSDEQPLPVETPSRSVDRSSLPPRAPPVLFA